MRPIVGTAILLIASVAAAQPAAGPGGEPAPRRWWGAVELGPSRLAGSAAPLDRARTGWRLKLAFGWQASPSFRVGVEASGVGLEAGNLVDPSRGESISELFAVAELHRAGGAGPFAAVGVGRCVYTNNEAAWFDHEGSGLGMQASLGYAFATGERFALAPVLEWSSGRVSPRASGLDDLRYDAVSVTLRIGYR